MRADDRLFVRMRITERTPDLLVLRQTAWTGRLIGVFFALIGAGAIVFFTHMARVSPGSVHGPVFVVWVVGGMFMLVGLTLAAVTRTEYVAFDRKAGVVHLTSGKTTTDVPLAQVSGVALEASAGINSEPGATPQTFYRPMLILADGRHIPWTSVSTTDGRAQAACVAAARAFGRWTAAPTDTVPAPAPASGTAPVTRVRNVNANYGCAYAMLGLFTLAGCWMAGLDALRLATWEPVPATVMGSAIETIHGNKGGVSYRPAVTYWYYRYGHQYVATGVTPLKFGASWKWAEGITRRFPSGMQVTAYVDPHNPTRAYLLHQFDMLPAVLLGIVAVMWVLVWWGQRGNMRLTSNPSDLGVPVLQR